MISQSTAIFPGILALSLALCHVGASVAEDSQQRRLQVSTAPDHRVERHSGTIVYDGAGEDAVRPAPVASFDRPQNTVFVGASDATVEGSEEETSDDCG